MLNRVDISPEVLRQMQVVKVIINEKNHHTGVIIFSKAYDKQEDGFKVKLCTLKLNGKTDKYEVQEEKAAFHVLTYEEILSFSEQFQHMTAVDYLLH